MEQLFVGLWHGGLTVDFIFMSEVGCQLRRCSSHNRLERTLMKRDEFDNYLKIVTFRDIVV